MNQANKKISHRLSRIVGQIEAVQRMIQDDSDCLQIASQLCAARRALDRTYFEVMRCRLEDQANPDDPEAFDAILTTFSKLA